MINRIIKTTLLIVVFSCVHSVSAETPLNGYLSTQFGMSAQDARKAFENDGIVFSSSETADGDYLIFAKREQSWITSDLLYVFPSNSDSLALIIEIFPGLLDSKPVRKELIEKLGEPSSDNYPELVLKGMQDAEVIPAGVNNLAVWNVSTDQTDREARVMSLDKYVRVEYIDNKLMKGNK
ncbi:MAG: hypothetical protein HN764_14555 [Gammaproteobacteria bacterium]|jgi:hypothetical protein|nr:hypothetical protein [Gammaproteobacteria bacterium]